MYTITEADGRVYATRDGKRAEPHELTDGGSLVGLPGDEIADADAERLGLAGSKAIKHKSIKAQLDAPENKGR